MVYNKNNDSDDAFSGSSNSGSSDGSSFVSNSAPSFTDQIEHLVEYTVSKMKPDGDMNLDDYIDILDNWKIIYSSYLDSIDVPSLVNNVSKSKNNFSEQLEFYSFVKKSSKMLKLCSMFII